MHPHSLLIDFFTGLFKLVFLVANLKPLVAKQNRASLARGAIINFYIPRVPHKLAIPDKFLLRVVLTIEDVKQWVLAILTFSFYHQ